MNNFYPKIESELWVKSDKMQLRGIIDRIECYSDKKIPVELKTGKAPMSGVWPGHQIQIGAYLLLMQEKLKDPAINEGYIHYLDSDKKISIMMNPFLRQKIIDLIQNVNNMLVSKTIPEKCGSEGKCNACGIKNQCSSP